MNRVCPGLDLKGVGGFLGYPYESGELRHLYDGVALLVPSERVRATMVGGRSNR